MKRDTTEYCASSPYRVHGLDAAHDACVYCGKTLKQEDQKERVWRALNKAAERIGLAAYRAGRYQVKRRRGKVVQGYSLSDAHLAVLEAMNALGRDEITPEEAMAVLHEYDVLKARTQRGNSNDR